MFGSIRTARATKRFALVAVTTLATTLLGAGPAAGQAQAAPLPPDQSWRSCGSLLINKASVDNRGDMFKVNMVPSHALRVPHPSVGAAWGDLRNCVSFPNWDTLRQQFDCHAAFGRKEPEWNMESDRFSNPDWKRDNPTQHKCNWGSSNGGGSS
ncbi:DUF2599 domain-containing protein [Actinopolyspora sp. H202]|uniref:DUF2599 domain-containing protein n=1 Tax=Actinopolyspora sp. H202 TaxID=1500456 RepID=UPI003EE7CF16